MDLLIVGGILGLVIGIYFKNNPMKHSGKFMFRRFVNWFPLGMTYAFLYMARYNLNVAKNAMGDAMDKSDFGIIFGVGTAVYGLSFLLNGPMVDRIGGKKGIIVAALGAAIFNILMGVATYAYMHNHMQFNLVLVFSILYAGNMFCQSYGAVSIIKVKAYWFHVRERGGFGAIFGTLLSFGAYFAYDWGQAVIDATKVTAPYELSMTQKFLRTVLGVDAGTTTMDGTWFVFFIPAFIMVLWALLDMILLKDTPSQANFEDFDTHDASSDEMDREYTIMELLKKIFSNPLILTFAAIEFCSGVLRNAVLQWYFIFADEVPQLGAEIFQKSPAGHWGMLLALGGMMGGFISGYGSDLLFHSRRGPPAMLLNAAMFVLCGVMASLLFSNPFIVGCCAIGIWTAVIGVHSLMSGTAAADFGGRKATATASGILDGFVYLGSAVQSICLGFLTEIDWHFWPLFMLPFAAIAVILAFRTWNALPEATKKYLVTVEKIEVTVKKRRYFILKRQQE